MVADVNKNRNVYIMKTLKILLGIFLTLGIVDCILFKSILSFSLILTITVILLFCVRANRKNGQDELLDNLNVSWFIICELIPLLYKLVHNINVFEKFELDRIINFTLLGPMILLVLTAFGLIRVKYNENT